MKTFFRYLSLFTAFPIVLFLYAAAWAAEPASNQQQTGTQKSVSIYWVDLGVNWSQPAIPAQPAMKRRDGATVRPEVPAVPALKLGDSLDRLKGPSIGGVQKEGEIAVPMPAGRPMTQAELNQFKTQLYQLIQQKIDKGVKKIELRAVEDMNLLTHVAEAKSPKSPSILYGNLHDQQRNLEQVSEAIGQTLAKVKFTNSEQTKVEINAVGGSNGGRTLARTIPKLGHNVVDHLILDSSRGKIPETERAVKTVGSDRTTIIVTKGDAPGQDDTVANHKAAQKIADKNPGVTLLYTTNTDGTSLNLSKNHIQNTAPGERSFEVQKYVGKGKYERGRIAGKSQILLDATKTKSGPSEDKSLSEFGKTKGTPENLATNQPSKTTPPQTKPTKSQSPTASNEVLNPNQRIKGDKDKATSTSTSPIPGGKSNITPLDEKPATTSKTGKNNALPSSATDKNSQQYKSSDKPGRDNEQNLLRELDFGDRQSSKKALPSKAEPLASSKKTTSNNHTTTSALAPRPGGILLDKAASFLGDINDITGAVFDAKTQQVVLIGKKNSLSPPMDKDHFAVALRAIYSGEAPAVSIDPTGNPNVMQVRYFGQIGNTDFGNILFEADRILKILSMGKDNVTGRPIYSKVNGYQNVLDRDSRSGYEGGGATSYRFWFKPKELEMQKSANGDFIRYTRASVECLVVKNESSAIGTTSQAFVDHLNAHYDEFAKEFRPLEQLTQLAKVVGFAFWLRERNIQIDLASLGIKSTNTPQSTPATTAVSKAKNWGDYSWTTMITGGVDFSKPPDFRPDVNQAAYTLGSNALKGRPADPTIPQWNFSADGESLFAVALPIVRKPIRQLVIPSGINLASTDGPGISSFSLEQGDDGLKMTINGNNFGIRDRTSQVLVNGASVSIESWSNQKITVFLPEESSEYSIVISRRNAQSSPLRLQTSPNPAGIINRIRNSQHAQLPPLTAERQIRGQRSEITIENGTPYGLRISIVGPEIKLLTIPSGQSRSLNLNLGAYEVGFEATGINPRTSGIRVMPLYSVWRIDNGVVYSVRLFMR